MRRLSAVFVLLAAVLGGLLTGAGAAHAEGADPICGPAQAGTPEVLCAVPAEFDNQPVSSTEWTKDGNSLPQFNNIRQIIVSCTPGQAVGIGLTLGFADGRIPRLGSTRITCPGKPLKLTYFDCDTGSALLVCSVIFEGGASPITVSWNINGAERPDLLNNTVARTGCVVGRPYRVIVTVRDPFVTLTDIQGLTCSKKQQ
ncbi:hypothetical protein [Actinomadura sp. 3N508]|uniref:hypothetical protein n=1 Tax=Actinomadura sp. 3N508 TaxID=3375153 RepID=UPI0037BDAD81